MRHRISVAEWVRQAFREARGKEPLQDPAAKISAVRRAVAHSFPTAEIDQLLAEIEHGYRQ